MVHIRRGLDSYILIHGPRLQLRVLVLKHGNLVERKALMVDLQRHIQCLNFVRRIGHLLWILLIGPGVLAVDGLQLLQTNFAD